MQAEYDTDLLVIGGGINGTGIAADAAGRGLKVTLCEQGDLASATSSKSSKLIHGGLRYLQYYEFRLVREALLEREILLKKAPHLITPLRFVIPHDARLKPAWLMRVGLFLYDHLAKRNDLPGSASLNLQQNVAGKILRKEFHRGFAYSDCWTDDARLVVANALAAAEKGAEILTRMRFIDAQRFPSHWQAVIQDVNSGETHSVQAKAIVNASGVWVNDIIENKLKLPAKHHILMVKGSHIVVPQLYAENFAYLLSTRDQRVVFIIPYLQHYSLIGTTDVAFHNNPLSAEISNEEIEYLCDTVNSYLQKPISRSDIIWSYAGVRPLYGKNTGKLSAITRDYTFELNAPPQQAPLLSIFGGKLTTYRKLAEHALHDLKPFFPHMGPAWTATTPLPGGEMPDGNFERFFAEFSQQYPWLEANLALRYAKNYGTRAIQLLCGARCMEDLGQRIGADLYERELDYLLQHEWAHTVEDVLWRRTKLGLSFSVAEMQALESRLECRAPPARPTCTVVPGSCG